MKSTKVCPKCKIEKTTDKYSKGASRCKECRKEYYLNEKDKIAEKYKEEKTSCAVFFRVCKKTGKLFTAKKPFAQYSEEGKRIRATERQNQFQERNHVEREIECRECGNDYVFTYGKRNPKFCSAKCCQKFNRRAREARLRASMRLVPHETIDPIKVFNRDKWRCKICGVKTPESLKGNCTKHNAPTLDHIIPIAKGGPHMYENLQLACRRCNSKKGDKLTGQLPLMIRM